MYITLEGQIGTGKSTFARSWVSAHPGYLLLKEPLPHTLLGAFYANPRGFGFTFQMVMLTHRLVQAETGSVQAPCVVDRGLVGDMAFALASLRLGRTTATNFRIYLATARELRSPGGTPSHVLYLHQTTAQCLRRIQARGRAAEQSIDAAYLQCVEDAHQDLLLAWMATDWLDPYLGPCPTIKVALDGDAMVPGPAAYAALPTAVVTPATGGWPWSSYLDRQAVWATLASGKPVRLEVPAANILW